MSYTQYTELLRAVLIRCGLTLQEASMLTFNSTRRTLPTAADMLEFDDADAQAISNWTDIPATAAKRQRGSMPMSRHYAEGKTSFTGEIKLRVLAAVIETTKWCIKHKRLTPNAKGMYARDAVTWEDIRLNKHHVASPEQLATSSKWGTYFHKNPVLKSDVVAKPEAGDADRDTTASKSSSSSASSDGTKDVDSESADEVQEVDGSAIEWFLQAGRVHLVSEYTVEGFQLSVCRAQKGTPFAHLPKEKGSGADAALCAGKICTSCIKKAPAAVRECLIHSHL
jgi:hypothetical protein